MILPFASFPSLQGRFCRVGATGVPAHLLCPSRAHGLEEKVQSGPHSRPCRLALTSQCGYGLPGAVCQKKKQQKKNKLAEKEKKIKSKNEEILNSPTDKMEGKLKSSWEGLWWKILLNLLQSRAWSTITLWSCFLLIPFDDGRKTPVPRTCNHSCDVPQNAGWLHRKMQWHLLYECQEGHELTISRHMFILGSGKIRSEFIY